MSRRVVCNVLERRSTDTKVDSVMKFRVVITAALLCLSCLVVVSQEPTVPANGLVITNDHERGIQLYREGKTAAAGDYFKL